MKNLKKNLNKLVSIGIALSKEKNINILLEKILNEARIISNSDGGTVYLVTDGGKKLNFEIMHTESLDIKFGGSSIPVPNTIPTLGPNRFSGFKFASFSASSVANIER